MCHIENIFIYWNTWECQKIMQISYRVECCFGDGNINLRSWNKKSHVIFQKHYLQFLFSVFNETDVTSETTNRACMLTVAAEKVTVITHHTERKVNPSKLTVWHYITSMVTFTYRWGKSARDDAKKYGNDDVVEIIDKYRKMKLHRVNLPIYTTLDGFSGYFLVFLKFNFLALLLLYVTWYTMWRLCMAYVLLTASGNLFWNTSDACETENCCFTGITHFSKKNKML